MSEWLWGVSGLTRYAAMTMVPLLEPPEQADVEENPDNLDKYRDKILSYLGMSAHEEFGGSVSVQAVVSSYLSGKQMDCSNAECIKIAEGNNPNAFYMWLMHYYNVPDALRQARDMFGECTTQLAYAIAQAETDVPLSVHILNLRRCNVSNAPEVPADFLESDNVAVDADAIVDAYIATGLAEMYDSDAVGEAMVRYKDKGVARYFPLIVWELEGRKVNPVETTIFEESECLL